MELTKRTDSALSMEIRRSYCAGHPFMYGRNGKAFPYHGIYNHSYS